MCLPTVPKIASFHYHLLWLCEQQCPTLRSLICIRASHPVSPGFTRLFIPVDVRAIVSCGLGVASHPLLGAFDMEWTTPQHEEIDLNCEISSYANAEL